MHDLTSPWERWNSATFQHLHATAASSPALIALAAWLSELPLFLALGLTAWQLLRRRDGAGAARVAIAFAIALLTEAAMSRFAFHPRPFAAGFGPAWVAHAANNSMPSTHVTLTWIMAITLAMRSQRWTSVVLFVLGGVLAWARIYVGIHWPADMVGAALSASLSVALAYVLERFGMRLIGRVRARQNAACRHRSDGGAQADRQLAIPLQREKS